MSAQPPTSRSVSRYPISPERRVEGLAYVLGCVRRSYAGQEITLSNLLDLVEKVADAREKHDDQAAVVHGLRLLEIAELNHLVGLLENRL